MRRQIMMKFASTLSLCLLASQIAMAQEFEQEPIRYSQSQPNNLVSRLIERVKAGETKLAHEEHFGYLRSLLTELDVPVQSQMLVFSKTSLQRHRISPRTPRALYFNDDVYVGFCQQGDVLEVSAVDPQLGTVFYTLDQDPHLAPNFRRQTDNCLICTARHKRRRFPAMSCGQFSPMPVACQFCPRGRIGSTKPLRSKNDGAAGMSPELTAIKSTSET
jgi:hypothetical protein